MSYCRDLCVPCTPPCELTCPPPWANTCNELCVTSCEDSKAVIYPPPVVLTFPGPILASCPQESVVGSCAPVSVPNPCGLETNGCRSSGNASGLRGSILLAGSNGGACNNNRPCNPPVVRGNGNGNTSSYRR
ncbi:PREDICTED: feather keratin 3-like [Leptosomus discolor]|nr:PREDICTED: feather keratin 3-like [Leptosomus discolor]